MKTHKQLHRLVIIVLSMGLAFLLLISQLVFSQAGPTREGFGPLRSSSSLYQDQTRPLLIERNALSAPLDKVATAAVEWQLYPLYGGEMMSMAMSPTNKDIVYVGTRDAGVFRTTNGGISWHPKRNGLTFWPINVLTVDPVNENVLYAGTEYAGVWKSSNGGTLWNQVHNGVLANGYSWIVRDIAIDHQNTQVIYVGYYEPYYGGHILKSVNGGASWEYKDSGLPKNEDGDADMVYSLAIDPENHLTLYAGTWGDGAFRTTNGGESWQAINCGMPDGWGDKYAYVYSFAFDPHHSNRLCSILGGVPDTEYYFFNADNCWERISTDNRVDHHIKFHPTDDAIMYSYGGFFGFFHISSDGGGAWGYAEDNIENVNDIVFHNDFPDTIYAATDWYGDEWDGFRSGGVYKTTDGATTWSEMTQGITARVISSVGIDPQNSDFIYAIDGRDHDALLLRSQDGGQTWQTGFHFDQESDLDFITVDPLMSQQIYAGGWAGDFYISTDYGQTFSTIDEVNNPTSITFDPELPSTIYVGTIGDGIYKSTDSGSTWTQKNNGLPGNDTWVDSIAVDPNNRSVIWAGTNVQEGIFKSEDGGENWVLKGLNDDFDAHKILSIAINPDNSDVIFAGTGAYGSGGSIYRTTNGGATWEQKITDISRVYQIAYDPRNSNRIYAATEGYGVLRSCDGGESWHNYSAGIFYPVLYSLAITQEDPPLLVAGTYGSGLYWIHPSLENLPPNMPSNPVPADGIGDVPTNQVLGWQGGDPDGEPVTYTVALGTSNPPPVMASDIVTTSYDPGPLNSGVTYYWVITATDGLSETVGPVWSFTTLQNQPPNMPSNPVPADGTGDVPTNQVLGWQGGDPDGEPVTYTVALGTSNPPPVMASDIVTTSYDPGPLNSGVTYYWVITATDGLSETVGPVWSFTTLQNQPPNMPSNPVPADGIGDVPTNQVLGWQGGDPGGEPVTYTVALGTSNPPPVTASDIVTTSYDPGPLNSGVTYYWRITATDGLSETVGPVWSFTTLQNQPPNMPSNPVPADGTGDVPTNQILGWQGGDPDGEPVTYTVALGTSNPPPVTASDIVTTSYDPGPLNSGATYYWRITATDGLSETVGPVWSFTTLQNQPPNMPSNPVPADGTGDVPTNQVLGWQGGDPDGELVTYTVALGTNNPPPVMAADIVTTSYDPGLLNSGTTYYWRITATDGLSETVGPVWAFTTLPTHRIFLPVVTRN